MSEDIIKPLNGDELNERLDKEYAEKAKAAGCRWAKENAGCPKLGHLPNLGHLAHLCENGIGQDAVSLVYALRPGVYKHPHEFWVEVGAIKNMNDQLPGSTYIQAFIEGLLAGWEETKG